MEEPKADMEEPQKQEEEPQEDPEKAVEQEVKEQPNELEEQKRHSDRSREQQFVDDEDDEDDLLGSRAKSSSDDGYKDQLKRLLMQKSKPEPERDIYRDEEYEQEEHEGLDSHMKEYLRENGNEDYYEDYQKHKAMKHDIHRDGPATELSNDVLSYERFYPGRILGNTFTIANKTNETLEIHLDFTRKGLDNNFAKKRLLEFYEVSNVEDIEQPYQNYLESKFIDAEDKYKWWYIEDPYKKTLVKSVDYELKPGDSFEFIIVLKSPIVKKTYFLTTNVRVINSTHGEEHWVFAFGSLDVPKLSCPKEIMDKDNNYAWVKVVMRKKVPLQIFKFLLVNKGDMPINVTFSSLENDEMLLFSIKNPNMMIDGNMRNILEVKAHHKYKNIPDKKWKNMNNHKLIIGKIKDCELKFSLIINVIIIRD